MSQGRHKIVTTLHTDCDSTILELRAQYPLNILGSVKGNLNQITKYGQI